MFDIISDVYPSNLCQPITCFIINNFQDTLCEKLYLYIQTIAFSYNMNGKC